MTSPQPADRDLRDSPAAGPWGDGEDTAGKPSWRERIQRGRSDYDPADVLYEHDDYGDGHHWFSAQDPHAGEIGYADVYERQGPGGPHVEVRELRSYCQGHGIGTRLLNNVAGHFQDREIRLKPYPIDADGDSPDVEDLQDYYEGRGFEPYRLKDGDPNELSDWMTRPGGAPIGQPRAQALRTVAFAQPSIPARPPAPAALAAAHRTRGGPASHGRAAGMPSASGQRGRRKLP